MSNIPTILLASTSPTRRNLLTDAGVECEAEKPAVNERDLKLSMRDIPPSEIAQRLADAKALSLSIHRGPQPVIGADQTLLFGTELFDKSTTLQEARNVLLRLRNQSHILQSSVSIAIDGKIVWSFTDHAKLSMRNFTDDFLDDYIKAEGQDILDSVGGYKLEGRGLQLFERIEGDYFTILGLPLLPLLSQLRQSGYLAT